MTLINPYNIMKTEFKQGKGKWNKNYWTVQFKSTPDMKHWRKTKTHIDIMPKYNEIAEMIECLLACENEEKRPIKYKILKEALERGLNAEFKYNKLSVKDIRNDLEKLGCEATSY